MSGELVGFAMDFASDMRSTIGVACAENDTRRLLAELPQRQRDSLNAFYAQLARGVSESTAAKTRDVLVGELADTVHLKPRERRAKIKRALVDLGIQKGQEGIVQTVVRTQGSIAYCAALWVHTQRDPRVWGFAYQTADDERVRPSHEDLSNVRYPKRHLFWKRYAPPNGFNCRCRLRPIYFGDKDARIRPFIGTPDVDAEFRWNPGNLFLETGR